MERQKKTNRAHLLSLAALAGLATACAPSHQGQSRYGVDVLANSSQPALRPSCNTYVQPCGVPMGYYVEQFSYVPQMPVQPLPQPPVVVEQPPVETPPIYVEPAAPIPEVPTYTPVEPHWPEVDTPAPTWTPIRK
ncbi:hypothetical protein GCM10011309_01790 [Litorimonas cladophorae]|uniref:Uncharacterized protein n=1 Tax=Litorimonas cladophorae TaxID=1220491 RepID=A0A918KAH2_9PROT|nr:hypothetical protein [Litorimonas cladophorae]GGX56601.1 hypothetical protein GCM10011309_01790 [Litorimonas cladophorae]